MSKFSRGVELFYPGMIWHFIENNRLNSGGGLAVKVVWGRRAEDPFRGLRAGPVRYSPLYLRRPVTGTTVRIVTTPQTPQIIPNTAKVCALRESLGWVKRG